MIPALLLLALIPGRLWPLAFFAYQAFFQAFLCSKLFDDVFCLAFFNDRNCACANLQPSSSAELFFAWHFNAKDMFFLADKRQVHHHFWGREIFCDDNEFCSSS